MVILKAVSTGMVIQFMLLGMQCKKLIQMLQIQNELKTVTRKDGSSFRKYSHQLSQKSNPPRFVIPSTYPVSIVIPPTYPVFYCYSTNLPSFHCYSTNLTSFLLFFHQLTQFSIVFSRTYSVFYCYSTNLPSFYCYSTNLPNCLILVSIMRICQGREWA